jgi:hypothetical protein
MVQFPNLPFRARLSRQETDNIVTMNVLVIAEKKKEAQF